MEIRKRLEVILCICEPKLELPDWSPIQTEHSYGLLGGDREGDVEGEATLRTTLMSRFKERSVARRDARNVASGGRCD